jgi:DNA-binding NarL/FixJ family response regulator
MQRGTTYVNTLTPLRVLLIEDSPLIRERLFESLVDPGRIEIVGEADTEEAAVALVNDSPWDVLVLDLQLKHGTGLGVLRSLISHRTPDAKVIVLTNYAFPQYRAKSLALGADFFFDKSREYHRVREVLEGIADKRMSAEF